MRALVVCAHPDDAEFTCAGTMALWTSQGHDVRYVICTDGSKGSHKPDTSAEELAALREAEQQAAADVLGVRELVFLRHPDGELSRSSSLEAELTLHIRRFRPDILLTFDPWRPYQLHPDHRAVGFTALNALLAAGNAGFYSEQLAKGLEPWAIPQVLLFNTDRPDHWVDITSTMEVKLEALCCHKSQVTYIEDLEERVRAWNASLGQGEGFAYAEAFKRLNPGCDLCQ